MIKKAELNKPFTENERVDFIVTQNHQKGYEIKETETALEAWGLTDEEIAEQEKEAHKKELMAQLDEYDLKEIRPMAAKAAGVATEEDEARLAEYEERKAAIRQQLKEL